MNSNHLLRTVFAVAALCGAAVPVRAAAPAADAPNTRDYPGMPRYEGSSIVLQSQQKFGELGLQISGLSTPDSSDPKELRKVEGRVHRTTYLFPNTGDGRRTTLEIARNYEQSFVQAGFKTLWSGGQAEIRNGPPKHYYAVPELDHQLLTTGVKDRRYFCMEKPGLFAAIYLATRSWQHVISAKSPANFWTKDVPVAEGTVVIQVDYVDTRPMEEKMVMVSAAEMSKSISANGKVALYGLHFDFNKAELKPESAPTLEEMAKLLKAEPGLEVLVVGHTDNVGAFDFNQDLSLRRARAIATALATKHGIERERLTPMGAAFMAPVTTNATEEGRALNRRVELVPR